MSNIIFGVTLLFVASFMVIYALKSVAKKI